MANESTLRSYRDFDAYNREAYTTESAPRREGGDPLAELARIMGQDQHYTDMLKSVARTREPAEPAFAEPVHQDAAEGLDGLELRGSAPASDNIDWDDLEAELETYQRSESAPEAADHDAGQEWDESATAELERLLAEEHRRSEAAGGPGLAYGVAAGAAVAGAAALAYRAGRGPQAAPQGQGAPADAGYPAQSHYASQDQHAAAYAPQDLHPANDYDAPPRRRSAGLTAIAAVMALAVVGGGSVMAYRAFKGGAGSGGEPRIVRANPEPVRVAVQQAQEATPTSTRSGGERMVSREERPVTAREQAALVQQPPAPSRVIPLIPAPGGQSAPVGMVTDPGTAPPVRTVAAVPVASPPPAAAMTTAPAAPALASAPMPSRRPAEEPRRVRTVQVGPDGNFLNAPAPRPQAAPAASQQALSVVPSAPTPALAAADSRAAAAPRPPARPAPQAAPTPAPAAAPLSLAPQQRTAALHTASVRPAATAAPAPATGGGTFVQISSHQSESEARSAFASAQRRYPLLQGQAANIRTAEIAGRGTWHRLRVGPFSREGAQDFCQRLKAAGGSCVLN